MMRATCCSWKCFATGLLISTLLFITIAMIGGLVAIPVIYVHWPKDHHQVSPYIITRVCNLYIMSTIGPASLLGILRGFLDLLLYG